jgi:hypothetical protein
MEIPTETIKSTGQFHEVIREHKNEEGSGWVFRGQADGSKPPVPTAGREQYFVPPTNRQTNPWFDDYDDLYRFRVWQHEVHPYVATLPSSDLEALAFAQHHGLATRLLDWTEHPLVAAFFAVRDEPTKDGGILFHLPIDYADPTLKLPVKDPPPTGHGFQDLDAAVTFGGVSGTLLRTRYFDSRMLNQRGCFTIHCPPDRALGPYDEDDGPGCTVKKYVVPASIKEEMQDYLNELGVNDAFVYPDIDGVSWKVNWRTRLRVASARLRG